MPHSEHSSLGAALLQLEHLLHDLLLLDQEGPHDPATPVDALLSEQLHAGYY